MENEPFIYLDNQNWY